MRPLLGGARDPGREVRADAPGEVAADADVEQTPAAVAERVHARHRGRRPTTGTHVRGRQPPHLLHRGARLHPTCHMLKWFVDFAPSGTRRCAADAARRLRPRDRLPADLAHRPLQPAVRLLHAARRAHASCPRRSCSRRRRSRPSARGRGGRRLPEVPPDRRRADAPRPDLRRDRRAASRACRASRDLAHDDQRRPPAARSREPAAAAGLRRVNIHLDSLDPERRRAAHALGHARRDLGGHRGRRGGGPPRSSSTRSSSAASTRTTSCRSPRSRASATGTCASSRRCRSARGEPARVARDGLVPTRRDARAHRGGARPARCRSRRATPPTSRANYRAAGGARRRSGSSAR